MKKNQYSRAGYRLEFLRVFSRAAAPNPAASKRSPPHTQGFEERGISGTPVQLSPATSLHSKVAPELVGTQPSLEGQLSSS